MLDRSQSRLLTDRLLSDGLPVFSAALSAVLRAPPLPSPPLRRTLTTELRCSVTQHCNCAPIALCPKSADTKHAT